MPPRSKAQARAMFAAASGNSTIGIPKKVGAEFTSDLAKGSVKKLPQKVSKKRSMKNGQVSERARGRMEARTSNGAKDSSGGKDPDNIPGVTS